MHSILKDNSFKYLAACRIEKLRAPNGKKIHVWVPSKDDGIDFLITYGNKPVHHSTIQVKGSRDYLLKDETNLPNTVKACGWWNLSSSKLEESEADYWVLVLRSLPAKKNRKRAANYIIIKPAELLSKLVKTYGKRPAFPAYLWTTHDGRCIDMRGLRKSDKIAILDGSKTIPESRNYSNYLDKWEQISARH
jgi:hypothetical protein